MWTSYLYAPHRAIGGDQLEPVVAPGRREGARHAVHHAAGRSGIHSEQIKLSIRLGSALSLRLLKAIYLKKDAHGTLISLDIEKSYGVSTLSFHQSYSYLWLLQIY